MAAQRAAVRVGAHLRGQGLSQAPRHCRSMLSSIPSARPPALQVAVQGRGLASGSVAPAVSGVAGAEDPTTRGALAKWAANSTAAVAAYLLGSTTAAAECSEQDETTAGDPSQEVTSNDSDEEPAYNKDHYPNGLNANFVCGDPDAILKLHAGEGGKGGGRFEDPETRDIARGRESLVAAVSKFATLKGAAVADIGAGTGLFLETFRDAVGQEGSVYAVELSEAFCANLKVRADEDKSGAKVEVVRCTDTACNLPEASVDVAFICDVYHHFEYPKTFMRSLKAAMKPGGTVVVVDFHRDEAKITSKAKGWVTAHVRADQAIFKAEIEAAGFTYVADADVPELHENYVMIFWNL